MRLSASLLALLLLALPAAAQEGATPTFYLVRHAEKAGPSGDVPLSDAGRLRARALRDTLAARGVEVIVASQFRRTAETAQPLADTLGLTLTVRPLSGPDVVASARAVVAALASEVAGRTVLVVGHSNTIPAMLAALTGTPRADLSDGDYDGLYVVRLSAGRATALRLRFGADDGVADPE